MEPLVGAGGVLVVLRVPRQGQYGVYPREVDRPNTASSSSSGYPPRQWLSTTQWYQRSTPCTPMMNSGTGLANSTVLTAGTSLSAHVTPPLSRSCATTSWPDRSPAPASTAEEETRCPGSCWVYPWSTTTSSSPPTSMRPRARRPTPNNLLMFYCAGENRLHNVVERPEIAGYAPVALENPYWRTGGVAFEDPDGWRIVLMPTKVF